MNQFNSFWTFVVDRELNRSPGCPDMRNIAIINYPNWRTVGIQHRVVVMSKICNKVATTRICGLALIHYLSIHRLIKVTTKMTSHSRLINIYRLSKKPAFKFIKARYEEECIIFEICITINTLINKV